MSTHSHSSALQSTPKTKFHTQSSTKSNRHETRLQLSLETVIGITTSSASGFDCRPKLHSFAACAGTAVVLSHVDEQLNISQKFYRASPSSALPANPGLSYYNPTAASGLSDGLKNTGSPLKDSFPGITSTAGHADSAGKNSASTRTRIASCVSLSPDGQLLAVGEVSPNLILSSQAESSRPATTPGFAFSGAQAMLP